MGQLQKVQEHVKVRLLTFFVLVAVLMPNHAPAKTQRDLSQKAAFIKTHPCPSTGKTRGRCQGYVVDHIKPLCAGGADRPSNMQWQTREEAKLKDREERKICGR